MTGDTTPPAVRLLAERLWKDYDSQYSADHLTWVDFEPEARGHLQALADAGLLCSSPVVQPQQDEEGSLRSEPPAAGEDDTEKLIDVVAEALRERPFHFGPNTRESIVRGMDKVWLTGNERRDLARMALDAVNQVKLEAP